ncbi:hypothetical protein, partial [Streptomyces sp. NPDC003514]
MGDPLCSGTGRTPYGTGARRGADRSPAGQRPTTSGASSVQFTGGRVDDHPGVERERQLGQRADGTGGTH